MHASVLDLPGISIHYKTWGHHYNPPILALHGWLDNANSFDLLAPLLATKYFFIAIDLPGHGLSSHLPPGMHYHFIDGVFTILNLMKALELQKVHLLGHSLGACLASIIAGVAPHNFLSLAAIEGLGPFSQPEETANFQLKRYYQNCTSHAKTPRGYPSKEAAALARAKKGYVSKAIADILCARGVYEKNGTFYWRHDRRLLYPSPLQMTEKQILSCLGNIQAPTLLIWASAGFDFGAPLMQNRINAVNQIQIGYLQGGHHIHLEQPEATQKLLVDFYASLACA